jgi:hypothetical protein
MHSGAMIYIDSTPTSTPLLHDTTHILNWHFGLLSENFPLPSETMFTALNNDISNYHYPCDDIYEEIIEPIFDEEVIESIFADEFFKYQVANHYMTSVKTFFEFFMPYVDMHPYFRESMLKSMSDKAIAQ